MVLVCNFVARERELVAREYIWMALARARCSFGGMSIHEHRINQRYNHFIDSCNDTKSHLKDTCTNYARKGQRKEITKHHHKLPGQSRQKSPDPRAQPSQ